MVEIIECGLDQLTKLVKQQYHSKTKVMHACLSFGAAIEELIEQINLLGGTPAIGHDQWYGVEAKGNVMHFTEDNKEQEVETFVTSESLVIALVQTYLRWKEAWQKLNERQWSDPVFTVILTG